MGTDFVDEPRQPRPEGREQKPSSRSVLTREREARREVTPWFTTEAFLPVLRPSDLTR